MSRSSAEPGRAEIPPSEDQCIVPGYNRARPVSAAPDRLAARTKEPQPPE
ncbi:hypothetical protein [Amycolatopsis plumensis]